MKTYQPKEAEVKRKWHLIDANKAVLGRLATNAAQMLMGKHKATYSAHMDSGDYVVVVNAEKVVLTGKKPQQKVYRSHSGYPGGFKEVKFAQMAKSYPARVVEHAIAGMLPENRLKAKRLARLKIVIGEEHAFKDQLNTKN